MLGYLGSAFSISFFLHHPQYENPSVFCAVIAPDFFLKFAGFFPREKSCKTRKKFGTSSLAPGKNSVKNNGFSLRYSAWKLHSRLLIRTFYVGKRTSPAPPPPARPGPQWPPIPARPAILARPSLPAPAQRSGICDRIFPGLSTVFFSRHTGFFPHVRGNKGKIRYKRRKLNYCIEVTLPAKQPRAAHNVVSRHLVELQPSACTQCCISHSNCPKSQNTLTVTPSRESFGFFGITSSWCYAGVA